MGETDIYIDFDDCLCETAKFFSKLVHKMFDKDVPYENIRFFDLQDSFGLTEEEFGRMMAEAHKPEALLSYEETPDACRVVNSWVDKGYHVSIITGRPSGAYDASMKWLVDHGLDRVKLFCLNKYGRNGFLSGSSYSLELEDYYKMHFDFVVEDSPSAFKHLTHLENARIMVLDRPWNKGCEFPNGNFHRCYDWKQIEQEL